MHSLISIKVVAFSFSELNPFRFRFLFALALLLLDEPDGIIALKQSCRNRGLWLCGAYGIVTVSGSYCYSHMWCV